MNSKYRGLMSSYLLLSALLVLAACSTVGTSKVSGAPSISAAGNGMPGGKLEVNGSGFVPGEIIELVLEMGDAPMIIGGVKGEELEEIKANEKGMFNTKTAYPHKSIALPGAWDLIATGNKGSTSKCKVEIKKPK
jgi:hypothetical protein